MTTKLSGIGQPQLNQELARLKASLREQTPENPALRGFKVFSQNDEDGIIETCLTKIEEQVGLSKTFVEIGCGNGLENNTHYLLLKGYRGVWVDASEENVSTIEKALGGLAFDQLIVAKHLLDCESIRHVLAGFVEFLETYEPDLFSLDVDGNDYYLLREALKIIRPKLLCIEYNAKFPPPVVLCANYRRDRVWDGNDYFGASLQAFVDGLPEYRLVACGLAGVNAFFVRADMADVFQHYSVAQLFQPARYEFAEMKSGHPPSMDWLRQILVSTS